MWKASLCILVAMSLCRVASAEQKTWEYSRDRQWPQVAAEQQSATAEQSASPTLDLVEQLLKQNSSRAAKKHAIKWVKANKDHPQRDRGLYLIAQSLYQYGDRIKAYYYLDQLLDEYPDSRFYYGALELQYKIADRYLHGYKRRFVGVPMFQAKEEAVEMLYRIQNRSPGSPLAEKSMLRTADFYFEDRQYDFAADTYAAYMRTYPRSPHAPRARLRQAFSSYAQFRGPRFDATPVIDAREQLRSVMAQDEQLAREENVPALLEQIDRDLAKKLYLTAEFYRRTEEPRGAVYTYRYLTQAFPESPEAKKAQARLRDLPAWALNSTPAPAITPGFAPGSPPADEPQISLDRQRQR